MLWNAISSQQQYVYLSTENSQGSTTGAQKNSTVAVTRFPTESVVRDAIQSTLKQELGSYLSQLPATTQAQQHLLPSNPPDVIENSTENIQAFTDSMNVIENAIGEGEWTIESNARLLGYTQQLTFPQRNKLMEKLMSAVNSQEIKMQTGIPAL